MQDISTPRENSWTVVPVSDSANRRARRSTARGAIACHVTVAFGVQVGRKRGTNDVELIAADERCPVVFEFLPSLAAVRKLLRAGVAEEEHARPAVCGMRRSADDSRASPNRIAS